MGLFTRRREPKQESVQKMLQLASSFGQRAVEQYRADVNELGFEPQLGGEVKARLLGAAVPTAAHSKKYGLTDWPRVASSMVLHTLSRAAAEAVPYREDTWVNPERLAEYGTTALLFVNERAVWHLSQIYQAALLDSLEGEDYLEQMKADEQLEKQFLRAAAAFVEELVSTWTIQAGLELGQGVWRRWSKKLLG